jgi:hypothetical protein
MWHWYVPLAPFSWHVCGGAIIVQSTQLWPAAAHALFASPIWQWL